MSVYKRGDVWGIDYYYPPGRGGKRIRERVGPIKAEAQILLAERLQDIRQGRNPALRQIRPKPFEDMVSEFLEKHVGVPVETHIKDDKPQIRRVKDRPVTGLRRDYESFIHNSNILLRHFEKKTLQEIGPKQIETFVASRLSAGVSKATVNRQRSVLSKIYACAIDWGYFGGENPVRKVKRFAETTGRTRFLSAEEGRKLVESAPRHLKPVIVAALRTGGRRREILRLRWEDVDLDRGVLYFDQTNTKSGKQREVPIDPVLAEALKERRKVTAIGGDAREYVFTRYGKRLTVIKRAFESARKKADLGDDVTFHTLRHTFASWYVLNGGDLYRLQKYLGHSTIALTQRYAHLSADHLRDGVRFFGEPEATRSHAVDTKRTGMTSSRPASP